MRSFPWFLLVSALVLFACGGEESPGDGSSGAGPGGGVAGVGGAGVGGAGGGAPAAYEQIDPNLVCLQDWELYPTTPFHHALIRGQALDEDGKPVPNPRATIAFRCDLPFLPPHLGRTVVGDEGGVFVLEDVPANALVCVEAEGFAGRVVPVFTLIPSSGGLPSVVLGEAASVTGLVHFADGTPAPDAEIVLSCPLPEWYRVVRTDAEGRFRADDAPPEPLIAAAVPGRLGGEAKRFEFEDGADRVIDLEVKPLAALEGRIEVAATGGAIPGGVVRSIVERTEAAAVADENGRFRLEGAHLPMVFALGPGFGEKPITWNPKATPREDLLVSLVSGGGVRGRVVDQHGAPLSGHRVIGLVSPEQAGARRQRGPLTREDGSFEYSWLAVPPAGAQVALMAEAQGSAPSIGPILDVRRGRLIGGVEIVVPARCRVFVRALDDRDAPRAYCSVTMDEILPESLPDGLRTTAAAHSEAVADAEGRAILTGLRPGDYRLTVWAKDRVPYRKQATVAGEGDVSLPDVVCPIGQTIRGSLTSDGGEFARPPRVELIDPESNERIPIHVEPDGHFSVSGLEEKKYALQCDAPDHEPVTRSIEPGEDEVRIRLRALGRLTVTVLSSDDLPPEGAIEVQNVDPTSAVGRPWRKDLAGDDAKVVYEPLPPGEYYVRVSTEDQVGAAQVSVPPGEDASVEIALTPAAFVSGRVLRSGGELAMDVGVDLDAGKIWGSRGTRTDDRGAFRSPALLPGDVIVRSHPFGHPATEKRVTVAGGEEAETVLELADGATVDLSVTDMDGEAMEGVTVTLHGEDGEEARYWIESRGKAETNAEGKIKLLGVPPGRYLLSLLVGGDWRERMTIDLVEGETWNNGGAPVKLER